MIGQIPSQHQTNVRPLWQLFLAEQTGQLAPLSCEEYQALVDFLNQLVLEGCDPGEISQRMADILARAKKCGPAS